MSIIAITSGLGVANYSTNEVELVNESKRLPSLFALYLKEREGLDVLETEQGYASYRITGKEVYIQDIFVLKEFRKNYVATKMANQIAKIAKEQGCTHMFGSVCPSLPSATASIQVLISYGMRLSHSNNTFVFLVKELV